MRYRPKDTQRTTPQVRMKGILPLSLAGLICLACLTGCEDTPSFSGPQPEPIHPAAGTQAQDTGRPAPAPTSREPDVQGGFPSPSEPAAQGGFQTPETGSADLSGRFPGRITSVLYAGAGKLLVCADSLSLYDAAADRIIGEYSFPENQVRLRGLGVFSGGYALFGELEDTGPDSGSGSLSMTASSGNEEGLRCWIFDGQLALQKSLDLHRLLKEQGYNETELSAAIAGDGTQIAVCGLRRLYVYHVEDNSFSVLLDSQAEGSGMRGISVLDAQFTGRGDDPSRGLEGLIFTGIAIPEGKSDSVPIYGTVNLDGSGLACHTTSDYALSGEMISYGNEIWFPEDFQKAAGRLLVTDPAGQRVRTVELEGEDTGADGIFGSDSGKYIATLGIPDLTDEWHGGWRLRIYDAERGKLVWEQNVGMDTSAYSGVSCSVKILDEQRECVVICGRGENTDVSSYFF